MPFKYSSVVLIIFVGTPTTTELCGISLVTTEPASIITLLPIVTPGNIMLLAPI